MPRPHAPIALLAALTALLVLPAIGIAAGADDAALAVAPVGDAPAASSSTARSSGPARGLPTPAQVDAYLLSKGSPMAGQGAAFVASGGRWQLDPRLLVAIAGAESNFGQITCAPFNAWGWGCPNGPYEFGSWADGIDTVAEGLRTNYLSEGRTTVALIHQKYAPIGAANDPTGLNDNWTRNVSRFLIEQGGDPNDVDMDGVAGTIPLGPLGGAALESFGFEDSGQAAGAATKPALEVSVGAPKPLVVKVRNTGYVAWNARDVRLRRVDVEPRVVGAPYGALASGMSVQPGEEASFSVQLAAVGASDGTALTTWRLEGPSGPFGPEIERLVAFSVPPFVAGESTVERIPANAGIAGGTAWNVVVRVRNAGSETWTRDGDDAVYLGLRRSTAPGWTGEGWINERVATKMLEREAAPGEWASFAFRARGGQGSFEVQPFRTSGWSEGDPATVSLG